MNTKDNNYLGRWQKDGFTLDLWHTGSKHDDIFLREVLSYVFRDKGKIIFTGCDYSPSPCHAIDGKESILGLLGFLSLKKCDTDTEYFQNYTSKQLAWCDSNRCDELQMIVMEMEEGSDNNE